MENIKCDSCNEFFHIEKIKTKKVGTYKESAVRFSYFNCPKCKMKYFVGVKEKTLDKMIRTYKKKLNEIKLMMDVEDRDIEQIAMRQTEAREQQMEIRAMSDMLKVLYKLK